MIASPEESTDTSIPTVASVSSPTSAVCHVTQEPNPREVSNSWPEETTTRSSNKTPSIPVNDSGPPPLFSCKTLRSQTLPGPDPRDLNPSKLPKTSLLKPRTKPAFAPDLVPRMPTVFQMPALLLITSSTLPEMMKLPKLLPKLLPQPDAQLSLPAALPPLHLPPLLLATLTLTQKLIASP